MMLPRLPSRSKIRQRALVQFGGYDHRIGSGDGSIWNMKNMTGDDYPVLSSRRLRKNIGTVSSPHGLYAHDGLYTVQGTALYKDGVQIATGLTDTDKTLCALGPQLLILPDKKVWNTVTGTMTGVEVSTGAVSAKIQNGTYAGETAEANTIYAASVTWSNLFRVGDVVHVSGATVHPQNNGAHIVREIDGNYLRFYENVFTIGTGGDTESALTVARTMPDLDFVCENENRLWACKGDTIYASALGDAIVWDRYDGISTDSFAVDVGSEGDFTACTSYLGYPCFFKSEHVYKVYGDKPSNYQVMGSATLGVMEGCEKSLAVAGETLYYLSRAGFVAYNGGLPQQIGAAFGEMRFLEAVGGSDGLKYYVSAKDASNYWHLFVLDTRTGMWHREDDTHALWFTYDGGLKWIAGTTLWGDSSTTGTAETAFDSFVETGDFYEFNSRDNVGMNHKQPVRLLLRLECAAAVTVQLMYDSSGTWQTAAQIAATGKTSRYFAVPIKRCDHYRIRISSAGAWKLYSLTREFYSGSQF